MKKDTEQKYKDFLSTVSHELRTPLTSIRGFADTILMSYHQLSDEQKIKFIQIIKEQSNRLIELVENILAASKCDEKNNEKYIMKAVNVLKTIKSAIALLQSKYPNYKFNINNFTHDDLIYADENKLLQVFINLLENACKYSPENFNVDITLKTEADEFVVQIRDYGIGIEEKDFENIFNKFSRIDNPLTRKTEGSGIGLYITKSIIEKMNGKIYPQKVDKGACFVLKFDFYDIQKHSQNKILGE